MADLTRDGASINGTTLPAGPVVLVAASTGPLTGPVVVKVAGTDLSWTAEHTDAPGAGTATDVDVNLSAVPSGPATLTLDATSAANGRVYRSQHPVVVAVTPAHPFTVVDGVHCYTEPLAAFTATELDAMEADTAVLHLVPAHGVTGRGAVVAL